MPETLDECIKILDESIEVLADLEVDLEEEKEDQIIPNMQLYQLYDMTEDVSHFSKIKHAEVNFMKRQSSGFWIIKTCEVLSVFLL